ncbi:MAG TPA: ankyrin repeat domain-containing protein [Edaphobacter sp.]|nr:ankyrin repeat domain-containing protein [Edaphobacter sp.]
MLLMVRVILLAPLLSSISLLAQNQRSASHPSFNYQEASPHEIAPHRRTIPTDGVRLGFNQLRLTLTVSPTGDVISANADGEAELLKLWPRLQNEVYQWKFTPFEKNGKPVTAEVEEYIDLVPPERRPKVHVPPPALKPDSKIAITLQRSGCFGSCPSYSVTISTEGIVFDGRSSVVANGTHTDKIDRDNIRALAKKIIASDFYSMDPEYAASVTDMPSFSLSITIDGHSRQVTDYVGQWVGMPAVINELEDEVDVLARTKRWIEGADGLVEVLRAEKFNFQTFEAQTMLEAAAGNGQTATVRQLLEAGVPLKPLPAPKAKKAYSSIPFEHVGWLNAASSHPETLQVFIDASASKDDQQDKDLALAGAANTGNLQAVQASIAYGANPNADLGKLIIAQTSGGMTMESQGAGSVLIYAAKSGKPDVVREILKYNPRIEAKDREGKTALFAAGEFRTGDEDGERVECVSLLAKAGANVNARDNNGNTPLHETFLTDVEEELLKLGANVNARNQEGETPIFTTVDNDAIPLFLKYGADLSIRNNQGKTILEAAANKGPTFTEALRKAMENRDKQQRTAH